MTSLCVAVDISKHKRANVVRTYRDLRNYLREDFCSKQLENFSDFDMILNTDDIFR